MPAFALLRKRLGRERPELAHRAGALEDQRDFLTQAAASGFRWPASSSRGDSGRRRRRRTPDSGDSFRSLRVAPTPHRTRPASIRFAGSRTASRRFRSSSGPVRRLQVRRAVDRAYAEWTAPGLTARSSVVCGFSGNVNGTLLRCVHRPTGRADQRLLHQPARHEHRWKPSQSDENVYDRRFRVRPRWTATANDLVFARRSVLRALPGLCGTTPRRSSFATSPRRGRRS